MNSYKKKVKCSECARIPVGGEDIDSWSIKQVAEDISLVCSDCAPKREEE